MMNSLMMNSMLVKVTDRGWQKLCKPTDRQQKGCQNWQSIAVQNALSATPCHIWATATKRFVGMICHIGYIIMLLGPMLANLFI